MSIVTDSGCVSKGKAEIQPVFDVFSLAELLETAIFLSLVKQFHC